MIGVCARASDQPAVEEFFQLFKTPWEWYKSGSPYDVVLVAMNEVPDVDARLLLVFSSTTTTLDAQYDLVAGSVTDGAILDCSSGEIPTYGKTLTLAAPTAKVCVKIGNAGAGLSWSMADRIVMRLGYDLFAEVRHLLTRGQPVERAAYPTLDRHIELLREWMLGAAVEFVEIPPVPVGFSFVACLTHDIDFAGIRLHRFDHTMWGFLYRSTFGALSRFLRGQLSFNRLLKSLQAVATLPFVHLGLAKDFWEPFEWYLTAEKGLPATYYLIPFKHRVGDRVASRTAARRACAYDVTDIPEWTDRLTRLGYELGVHGLDAWHDSDKGREELRRIPRPSIHANVGIRMHWLLSDDTTHRLLEDAGYAYDSTGGYNESLGYRNGTVQVFKPLGCRTLLELPLHVQDGALFLGGRMNLTESIAWQHCEVLMTNASCLGGVLTILWHDRSHGPERFWGDFYLRLLDALKGKNVWFATGAQAVDWFRKRRHVMFRARAAGNEGVSVESDPSCSHEVSPPLIVRVYPSGARPGGHQPAVQEMARGAIDIPWNGVGCLDVQAALSVPTS